MFNWFKKERKEAVLIKPVKPFNGEPKDDGNNYLMWHRWGAQSINFPLELLSDFYNELAAEDIEHVSVTLKHETEWSLSAYPSGALVYENAEEGEPRHMTGLSKEKTISLWEKLAKGDLEAIEQEKWEEGYPN